jgi:hypothetical protein
MHPYRTPANFKPESVLAVPERAYHPIAVAVGLFVIAVSTLVMQRLP